ncbi:MAG: HlyD family efflux transporter periplasmic adaptor subunit [Pseudomonadota bacterium]
MRATDAKSQAQARAASQSQAQAQVQAQAEVQAQLRAARGNEAVLAFDDSLRACGGETELVTVAVNEFRKLVNVRQVFLLRSIGRRTWRMRSISSVALVDRDTPFVRFVEGIAAQIERKQGSDAPFAFELPAFADHALDHANNYPFAQFFWQPLKRADGSAFAGLLLARGEAWQTHEHAIVARQADTIAQRWAALKGQKALAKPPIRRRLIALASAGLMIGIGMIPVPMTALAPAEIVARDPHKVTAPIEGVIEEVVVDPNTEVSLGAVLLRYEATTLKSRAVLSEEALRVANARYDRAQQAAFVDQEARRELAVLRNERDLKLAERDFAQLQFEKSEVKARRAGVVLFNDRDELVGRPVRTGEALMQIANPTETAVRIELPVADAFLLEGSPRVRLFLDSDPLRSIDAVLVTKAYHAEPNATQQLVYSLRAEFSKAAQSNSNERVRIGSRGTAQIVGPTVSLAFFLFRRPISAVRQYLGV